MNTTRRRTLLLSAVILVVVVAFVVVSPSSGPIHAGRPVSAWLDDLCSDVNGPSARFSAAYDVFSEMESDAVPYLTRQLRFDRYGVREKIIGFLRRLPFTSQRAARFILPSHRRENAAFALGQMGPKAEAAIPALLESWASGDSQMKVNAVNALTQIVPDFPDGVWTDSELIKAVSRRYPAQAARLGNEQTH